jgi:hypothetical protein
MQVFLTQPIKFKCLIREGPYLVELPVEKILYVCKACSSTDGEDYGFPRYVDNLKKEKEAKRKKFCYNNG